MTIQVAEPPPTVADATADMHLALRKFREEDTRYSRVRRGMNLTATRKALSDLGFAILDYIGKCVALAEAEDRRSAVWAGIRSRAMFPVAGPGREDVERAWQAYNTARRGGVQASITDTRAAWHAELIAWFRNINAKRLKEDEEHVAELRRRRDESGRLGATMAAGLSGSGTQDLVHESRERERQASIRRDATRYAPGPSGWQAY